MKNIKTSIINGTIMAFSFFITLSLTYIAYGYVSGLGGKIGGNSLTSSDWNSLVTNVDEIKGGAIIPTGFVGSFNLTDCPTGWTEYTPARGRFIRGIDSTGTNDSIRIAGDLQADDFKSHAHIFNGITLLDGGVNKFGYITGGARKEGVSITNGTGGIETRPKNVALLFCQKN